MALTMIGLLHKDNTNDYITSREEITLDKLYTKLLANDCTEEERLMICMTLKCIATKHKVRAEYFVFSEKLVIDLDKKIPAAKFSN